jgi:hypothetical protein
MGGCVFGPHPRRKVKPPKGVGAGHPCPASEVVLDVLRHSSALLGPRSS